jgi:solute carrier family 25 (adenine nucleotide translocator) protein 4/5/6/31
VYREQGIWAFWRGNVPNVMRTAGATALNFSLMDYYKRAAVSPWLQHGLLQKRATTTEQLKRHRQMMASFISGGLAGATATTILYPVEFLRTRLAMDVTSGADSTATTKKMGMVDVTRSILRADGVSGLYKGYGITLAAGIVYRLLHLGGYDALKIELLSRKQERYHQLQLTAPASLSSTQGQLPELTWTERFLVAEFVTLTAGTICYPFDSVRRRMMMQAGLPLDKRLYRNSIHCFQQVWAQEGARGFYLGLGPNIVRSLGGSLLLVAYDAFKVML